jgi:phosphoserine phosphatase RsbU/P
LLIVADVAGKGVPAALIMSGLRAAAHLCASMQIGMEEALERMNRLLYESTAAHHYVTAFLAEIDMQAGRIAYVNAGHPPPLLIYGGKIVRLREGTYPLGLFPNLKDPQFENRELIPGSMLVACTDGVSERTNSAGEEFGDTALHQFVVDNCALECDAFARNLLTAVRQYGDNLPFDDDVTLVVAKCR